MVSVFPSSKQQKAGHGMEVSSREWRMPGPAFVQMRKGWMGQNAAASMGVGFLFATATYSIPMGWPESAQFVNVNLSQLAFPCRLPVVLSGHACLKPP